MEHFKSLVHKLVCLWKAKGDRDLANSIFNYETLTGHKW